MPNPSINDLVTFDASVQSILSQTNGSYGVAISGDENTVAISGTSYTVFLTKSGNDWTQKGNSIARDGMGVFSTALSYDGNICYVISRVLKNSLGMYLDEKTIHIYSEGNWNRVWNLEGDAAASETTLSDNGNLFTITDEFSYQVFRYNQNTQTISSVTVESVGGIGQNVQIGQISNDGSILVTLCRTDNKIRLFTNDGNGYIFMSEITAEIFPQGSNVNISRSLNKVICTGNNFFYTAEIVNENILTNVSSRVNVGETITSQTLSPDGSTVYIGLGYANQIKIYNTEGQHPVLLEPTGTPAEISGSSGYGFSMQVGEKGSLIVGSNNSPYLFISPYNPPSFAFPSNTIVVYKDQPVPTDKYITEFTVYNPEITIDDVVFSCSGVVGGVFTTPGVFSADWTLNDGVTTVTSTGTILVLNQAYSAPICFVSGTKVTTDQGEIAIDKIIPGTHTINCEPVNDVSETINTEDTLVEIEKDALDIGIPNDRTVMTNKHKVSYNGKMVEARNLVGKNGVKHIGYTGEFVYNVVLPTHSTMLVHGMECETLDPDNIQYRLITLHKQLLFGRCTDDMGKEFYRLMEIHKKMCSI